MEETSTFAHRLHLTSFVCVVVILLLGCGSPEANPSKANLPKDNPPEEPPSRKEPSPPSRLTAEEVKAINEARAELKKLQVRASGDMHRVEVELNLERFYDEDGIKPEILGPLEKLPVVKLKVLAQRDAVLAQLKGLKNCEELHLHDPVVVTDEGVLHLAALTELRTLKMAGSRITDEGLRAIGNMTELRELDLGRSRKLKGTGFVHFKDLSKLERISLGIAGGYAGNAKSFHTSLVSLAGFEKLKTLKHLILAGNVKLPDEALAQLSTLNRLETLSLSQCEQVSAAGLAQLTKLRALKNLNLAHCPKLTDAALSHVSQILTIEDLLVSGSSMITDAGLVHLKSLVNLSDLAIGDASISDAGIGQLDTLSNLRSLHTWDTKVTAEGLQRLQKRLPKLTDVAPRVGQ